MVNYGRSRPEEITGAISGFLTVSQISGIDQADQLGCGRSESLDKGTGHTHNVQHTTSANHSGHD